jgi:hypothetical protein
MHNARSHMTLSNVIDQMMANAEEKKPNVQLAKLTQNQNQIYLDRMNRLKGGSKSDLNIKEKEVYLDQK